MCQELQIFVFVYMYLFGCKLSLFRLCDSDFGITAVDDVTIVTTCAVFCFHIAHISFASSWYLLCFSAIVLARLCVFGTAMSIKYVVFVFLFVQVIVRSVSRYCFNVTVFHTVVLRISLGIVLSVIMLRFQYSLKLSFSSTLAGVYL